MIFIASLIVTIGASLLQGTNLMMFGIVKPNLPLALLPVLATLDRSWIRRSILILTSALILKFSPGLEWLDIIFIGSLYIAIFLIDYLPWRQILNLVIGVMIASVMLNLISFNLLPLIYELAFNIVLASIFLGITKLIYAQRNS